MKGHQKVGIIVFVLGWLFLGSVGLAAESTAQFSCVTSGRQKIIKQNVPGAKAAAVNQALKKAVQNGFASLVSRQVFAANLEFLYTRVLPRQKDYVITYRVLGGIALGSDYLVGVESRVNLALLEKRLTEAKILNAATDKPMILLLVAEQGPGDILPRYWWKNNPEPYQSLAARTLMEQMIQSRFNFVKTPVDPAAYQVAFSTIYDPAAAVNLGRALDADLVVIGRARAMASGNRMGSEKIFDAVIDLAGYDLKSGREVIRSMNRAAAKSTPDTDGAVSAITKAAALSCADLIQKIDTFWNRNLRKESRFDLAIEGQAFLARFIALKKRLREIRAIENMQPKEIGSASAVLEVVYKGSPSQFADAVMLKTFDGFGLEIVDLTDARVEIRFIEKQAEIE